MESKIRTYQQLDYFEKHIIELLEKIHGRDRDDAVRILNNYQDVLKVLRDGQESANTFAEIFDDADKIGTSGDEWLNNMYSHLFDSVREIREFADYINSHDVPLTMHIEGVSNIDNKLYVAIYVGESQPTHTVRWGSFLVSVDKQDILAVDLINGKLLDLPTWSKLQAARNKYWDAQRKAEELENELKEIEIEITGSNEKLKQTI